MEMRCLLLCQVAFGLALKLMWVGVRSGRLPACSPDNRQLSRHPPMKQSSKSSLPTHCRLQTLLEFRLPDGLMVDFRCLVFFESHRTRGSLAPGVTFPGSMHLWPGSHCQFHNLGAAHIICLLFEPRLSITLFYSTPSLTFQKIKIGYPAKSRELSLFEGCFFCL